MKTYEVGIQIIEVWRVNIRATSPDDAEARTSELMVEEIRKQGEMQNIETDYATVVV